MRGTLHLFLTDALPEFDADEASELVLVEAEPGDWKEGEPIEPDEISFVSTLLTNYDDLGEMKAAVTQWWLDWAGVSPRLHLVADAPAKMAEDQRARLAKLEGANTWSLGTAFVGFRRDSRKARDEAIRFLIETATVRAEGSPAGENGGGEATFQRLSRR